MRAVDGTGRVAGRCAVAVRRPVCCGGHLDRYDSAERDVAGARPLTPQILQPPRPSFVEADFPVGYHALSTPSVTVDFRRGVNVAFVYVSRDWCVA